MYTDSSKSTLIDPSTTTLISGQRYYETFTVKNTGNLTWQPGTVRLATVLQDHSKGYISANGVFYDSSWMAPSRIVYYNGNSAIAPGQTATFEFWITAPTAGFHKDYVNLVNDNVAWFQNEQGANIWGTSQ